MDTVAEAIEWRMRRLQLAEKLGNSLEARLKVEIGRKSFQ